MDESALTSTQALDYNLACTTCAIGLSPAARSLADVGDPAAVPEEDEFRSPRANDLYDQLDAVSTELKAARGRLRELTAHLKKMATHYHLLSIRLGKRELAEEALRAVIP